MQADEHTGRFDPYVPTVLLRRLVESPEDTVLTCDGTVVFVDLSGFTRLSERLSRKGREGAEQLVDTISSCFSVLLAHSYDNGGSLLKFGGDALLLWFDGAQHVERAGDSAVEMRKKLREIGHIRTAASEVVLRMSVGVHSGAYQMFLVGGSHREFLIAGPAVGCVVAMEAAASAGQILVSGSTAALLSSRCLGGETGPGVLLSRSPAIERRVGFASGWRPPDEVVASCLSTALRAHLLSAPAAPEHRTAVASFLQFGSLDQLIADQGPAAAARAIDQLVRVAQDAADRYEVCFLGSDVASDGGKLLFSSGAPRAVGDSDERMLLAMRHIIEAEPQLPVRIGVNRGHVFTGEVGPPYRRTYAVMGDVVNLAARLSAKAPWGAIYATPEVVQHSNTRFDADSVEPFMVKGKIRPVEAWRVGRVLRAARQVSTSQLPLIGRDKELATLRAAIERARNGSGGLVEITGETGTGKSRLLSEAGDSAAGMRTVHATCEAYTRDVPYYAWREPLRQLLGIGWDDPHASAVDQLRAHLEAHADDLLPWLPLIAIAIGAEAQSTPEVDALAPEFRASRLHAVVLQLLDGALSTPTLVVIEHVHHMDEASASLLDAFAATLTDSSWLVAATRRDVKGGFVTTSQTAIQMSLEPLSREDTLALAEATDEAHHVPPHMLELAVERSGGSPEFLLDLLSAAASGSGTLPDSIEDATRARIDALDPGERALIRRAAVLGTSFLPKLLVHVLEADSAQPDDATWERLAEIFRRDSDGYIWFRRPAICEVAYEGLPFRIRRELHAAVGRALEPEIGRSAEAEPAILSLHFSHAGDSERARKYALMGAERAAGRFAYADAAHLYRRAIDASRASNASADEVADTWERLADALRRTGQPEATNDALSSARRLAAGNPTVQARLLYKHADIAGRRDRLTASVRWAKRGLRALDHVEGGEARGLRVQLLSVLAGSRAAQGRHREAVRLCEQVIAEAEDAGELRALARCYYVLDWSLLELGRLREPANSLRALEIYRELGDLNQEAMVLNNLGTFAYFRGEWDEAVRLYQDSGASSQKAGNATDPGIVDMNVGEILSDQGRLEEAAPLLTRALRILMATGDFHSAAFVDVLLGRLSMREGRHGEGLDLIHRGVDGLARLGVESYTGWSMLILAEAQLFSGDLAGADEVLLISDRLGDPYVPLLHRLRGVLRAGLGDHAGALEELHASLAAARARDAQYEIASTLAALRSVGVQVPGGEEECRAIEARLGIERLIVPAPVLQGTGAGVDQLTGLVARLA
jgi:class 3 adenylate cyclase/tetratricopeptide (TPR) repeat protein